MGTTVTANLGLIKPDVDERIQEALPTFPGWAAQNALNCDAIDGLFRMQTGTWSLTITASTPPTLGSGSLLEGKYLRVMPRLVVAYFRVNFGTTGFAAGVGQYSFNMPFTMDPSIKGMADSIPIGKAVFFDSSSTLDSSAFEVHYSTPSDNIFMRPPGANAWSATNPVVPGQGDALSGYYVYPTTDA